MVIGYTSEVLDIFFKKLHPSRTVTRVVPSTTLPPYTLPSHRVHSTDDIVTIQSMSSSQTSPAAPEVSLFSLSGSGLSPETLFFGGGGSFLILNSSLFFPCLSRLHTYLRVHFIGWPSRCIHPVFPHDQTHAMNSWQGCCRNDAVFSVITSGCVILTFPIMGDVHLHQLVMLVSAGFICYEITIFPL